MKLPRLERRSARLELGTKGELHARGGVVEGVRHPAPGNNREPGEPGMVRREGSGQAYILERSIGLT